MALRGSNPRFTRFVRWSIAAYFVMLFLFAALSDYSPVFDMIGRTFASGFLLFFIWLLTRFVWNWVVEPVFNTFLLLDPLGRQILERDTADTAVTVGLLLTLLCLAGAGVAGALFGAAHPTTEVALGWGSASAVGMLLSRGIRRHRGRRGQLVWAGFALALLGSYILVAGLVLDRPSIAGLAAVTLNVRIVILARRAAGRQVEPAQAWLARL